MKYILILFCFIFPISTYCQVFNKPVQIGNNNKQYNYYYESKLFSDSYKEQIIKQINDTIKKYNTICLHIFTIDGVTNNDVAYDIFEHIKKNMSFHVSSLGKVYGPDPFYGIDIRYIVDKEYIFHSNPPAFKTTRCINVYIGKVFKD